MARETGTRHRDRARQAIGKIRTLVAGALRNHPDTASVMAEIIEELERLERAVEGAGVGPSGEGAGARRRREQQKTYRVEDTGVEEVLAEYRPNDPNPHRCPQTTYQALAKVLSRSTRPLKYSEITKAVRKELGGVPADYQLRVALRFWSDHADLIERAHARYKARDSKRFVAAARKAWADFASKPGT